MADDYGADADFLAALASSQSRPSRPAQPTSRPIQQPAPQKIQQPAPQRLDRAPPAANASGAKIVQPTPQALPGRSSGSSILVSPRQKGNPVLACLRSMPWEYSDIPADYSMGLTTCALFLSLKYHRLHPEYIYTRIRNLQGKYNLRILLTLVDISNHEDSLRELSKTSLVNNVTVILCWSAAEAARYLELYKSYEQHASFAAIRGTQAQGYAERLVDFVTVPRAVNKADAIAIVSAFGSLRAAVNADQDQIAVVGGWGEKKVRAWRKAVEEPFRATKAAKRGVGSRRRDGAPGLRTEDSVLDRAVPISTVPAARVGAGGAAGESRQQPPQQRQQYRSMEDDIEDDEGALVAAAIEESRKTAPPQPPVAAASRRDDELSGGIAAALARLRENGRAG